MQYDNPNNKEMCQLLNATKLPYILMYKGSKGKVDEFQCSPSEFQHLIDAVNELADPAVAMEGDTWKESEMSDIVDELEVADTLNATIETTAVMRAKTMRKNERSKNHGRDKKCRTIVVVKNLNCGFCVSKLESTTSTMLYSHLGRYYLCSIPLVQFDFSVKEILAFHRNVIQFL